MKITSLCDHCQLPVGRLGQKRQIHGKERAFCCYGCYLAFQVQGGEFEDADVAGLLIRIGTGVFLAMNIMLFSLLIYSGTFNETDANIHFWLVVLMAVFATPLMLILGGPFILSAIKAAAAGNISGDSLVSIGIIAAYSYSIFMVIQGQVTVYFDTVAMVLLLFTAGRLLEAIAKAKAVRSLQPMFAAENASALVLDDGIEKRCSIDEISEGDRLLIKAGDLIPVDGIIVEGRSDCNESLLTGEPYPVAKNEGDRVYAGSINISGRIVVKTVLAGAETRWGKICIRVREAITSESKIQTSLDKLADVFVPFVLILAIASTIYWSNHIPLSEAIMVGLSVLVVACPCALGLAAPLAGSLGLKKAALAGCLIRSNLVLETLSKVSRVAFDKTGTLTGGVAQLVEILPLDFDGDELILQAVTVDQNVHHPLATAICEEANRRKITALTSLNSQVFPGLGVKAVTEVGEIAVGNAVFFEQLQWPVSESLCVDLANSQSVGLSRVYVGWNGKVRGCLGFTESVLPETATMIKRLKSLNLKTCILSGDSKTATQKVAGIIGIDRWHAELDPVSKAEFLKTWSTDSEPSAMVGDGINDAQVLAEAAVGISVASAIDLARETSDIILPATGLEILPWVISLSRQVQKIIYQNLSWAIGYNFVAIALAATGLIQPVMAAALMAGSSLFIVVNSLRIDNISSAEG